MISVIVPIFNGEKYLKRCLDSLAEQTYKEFEIIMVDDGSTDRTSEICKQYVNSDGRFIYLYKVNGGVGSARNYGVLCAKGELISFVDADDFVKKRYLEILINKLQIYKSDVCYCGTINCDSYGIPQQFSNKDCSIKLLESYNYDWMDFIDGHFTVWGGIYKKDLVEDVKFSEDLHVGEDTLWLAEIFARKNIKICSLHEKLYYYSILPNSAAHSKYSSKRYDEIVAWRKICTLYKNRNNSRAAYAVRIQEMYDNYKNDSSFSKSICMSLFKEYKECVIPIMGYWLLRSKYLSVFKIIFRCLQFQTYGLMKSI